MSDPKDVLAMIERFKRENPDFQARMHREVDAIETIFKWMKTVAVEVGYTRAAALWLGLAAVGLAISVETQPTEAVLMRSELAMKHVKGMSLDDMSTYLIMMSAKLQALIEEGDLRDGSKDI